VDSGRVARFFEIPAVVAALLVIPVVAIEASSSIGKPWTTILGREQILIEKNGGPQRSGGGSGNKINAIDPRKTEKMATAKKQAHKEFGRR
jgi:hypothetical protein